MANSNIKDSSDITLREFKCSGCYLVSTNEGIECNTCRYSDKKKIEYKNYKRRILLNDTK